MKSQLALVSAQVQLQAQNGLMVQPARAGGLLGARWVLLQVSLLSRLDYRRKLSLSPKGQAAEQQILPSAKP